MSDHPNPSAPHAVIIGSGIGGLAAAVRLGARGYRVTVLDRLDKPGGRAYVHDLEGFRFDAGPTIITAPFLLEELWSLCGRSFHQEIDLREMSPYYRIRFDDGDIFDYSGDVDSVKRQIARISPCDVEGYDRYLKASEKMYRVGFEKLGDRPFDSLWDMVPYLPEIASLRGDRSVHSMVSAYIKHPKIRMVLSFHPLLIGGNPFSVTSIYTLISYLERTWGVHSAIGGTGAIVDGIVSLVEGQGAVIRQNCDVASLTLEQDRVSGVLLASGEHVAADVVVSNADSAWTFRHLIPEHHRARWTDRKINRSKFSNGLFVWYFGTDCQYPEVPHHSILLGPRYRELLNDIFKRKVLAEDFSLYLHRPTATDPSLAPEGCDTFYALVPVPHLDADVDWSQYAPVFRERVQQYLENSMLPDLGKHLRVSQVTTPLDFRDRLKSVKGAGFSFEPVLTQSAWFRPHNRITEIPGLYLVGAGTHPGAGIPGVLTSAKVLDSVVPDVTFTR